MSNAVKVQVPTLIRYVIYSGLHQMYASISITPDGFKILNWVSDIHDATAIIEEDRARSFADRCKEEFGHVEPYVVQVIIPATGWIVDFGAAQGVLDRHTPS